ncbi:hypothetical protein WEU38_18265 (plasmid) [Cyanobacterium aponinum AL20118]
MLWFNEFSTDVSVTKLMGNSVNDKSHRDLILRGKYHQHSVGTWLV